MKGKFLSFKIVGFGQKMYFGSKAMDGFMKSLERCIYVFTEHFK